MYDLHGEVIVPCLRLPLRAQGIKHVARFVGFAWTNPDTGSQWSIAQYRRARLARDAAERDRLLAPIAEYNLDDLRAMRAVWDWIERHAPH
jgi:predicted RecB family nuclease